MRNFNHSLWIISSLLAIAAGAAQAQNDFSVGVEGYRDRYLEPGPMVDTHTDYGSVTATYTHDYNHFFTALDGRYSWGKADYKSPSGVLNNEPEFETDTRIRTGIEVTNWHGIAMPYIGLGWRYYFDQGKGLQTNSGKLAYDRHISQIYFPLGATFKFTSGDWVFTPMTEADILMWGRVSSHLAPVSSEDNITNIQHHGWGLRGEFMAGQQYKYFGWSFGPFIRYWHIADSSCKSTTNTPPPACLYEPKNTRLQTGAALRVNF